MSKPIIGLTGPSQFTAHCVKMVEDFFKGDPLMLYMNDPTSIRRWVKACKAVVLCGGVDIHPSVHGNDVYNGCGLSRFDHRRDLRELQIIDAAAEFNKPILGICRGHQLLGVSKGMRLITDISGGSVCHQPGQHIHLEEWEPTHSVELLNPAEFAQHFNYEGASERKLINQHMKYDSSKELWVNSFHHQALHFVGSKKNPEQVPGVKVYGIAHVGSNDFKYIIEIMGGNNWLSVQWHPEYDWENNTASKVVLSRFKQMIAGNACDFAKM